MAVRIGGQAVIEGVMMKNMDRYAVSVRKPNGKIETKSRRMRKLRRETSIISITSFSRNGKFPGIYGDRDEDTELFCIFLRRRRRTNREQDRTALRKDSWRESREDHHGNRTGIFTGNFHRIIYDPSIHLHPKHSES